MTLMTTYKFPWRLPEREWPRPAKCNRSPESMPAGILIAVSRRSLTYNSIVSWLHCSSKAHPSVASAGGAIFSKRPSTAALLALHDDAEATMIHELFAGATASRANFRLRVWFLPRTATGAAA
jgi:hypothetical protein